MMYIVGPCSAETREQVMETARQLSGAIPEGVIFRAGVWKPRSRPDTFQGAGDQALAWLQEVKTTFRMPVATEVATPEHVDAALQAGIDYLWIGARTSANPIAVQEIADAIGIQNAAYRTQTPKAILIKNPVNADAGLWLGNIERLERTGLPVIAVHRGCGHQPCWAMAHTVRLARPDIPMLLDPSHMSGDAEKVPALLERIPELGLDGAMIEAHCDPTSALSDAKQQITPAALSAAMQEHRPACGLTEQRAQTEYVELNWLRAEIDELDERLWDTLAARMDVSQRIGQWKKAHHVTPLQPERYQQIVERIKTKGERHEGLSTEFMLRIWEQIHEESVNAQM